jgi:hypothetical protein
MSDYLGQDLTLRVKTQERKEGKMNKKIIVTLTIALLLTSTLTIVSGEVTPELEAEIQASIEAGVAYVASMQELTGSWVGMDESYRAAYTGFALIKLQDYAYELGYESPFDSEYMYSDNVIAGWNWVFELDPASGMPKHVFKKLIGTQDHTLGASGTIDDPDTNANEYGLVFGIDTHRYVYSTGIMLMALEASGTPSRSCGIDFDGDTVPDSFFDVAQDATDWLAFAQGDSGGDEGGWYYSATAAGVPSTYEGGGEFWTDNSNGGFAVLGLAAAEGFGCTVPGWVKTELSVWIDTLQDPIDGDTHDGGSWYRPITTSHPAGYHWVNAYKTGNLIFEMTLVGDAPTTTRFMNAMDYIQRHWHDMGSGQYDTGWGYNTNPAAYLAMYTLMKGFEYSSIETIDISGLGGSATHDWYAEFAQVLVDQQSEVDGSWANAYWGDNLLNTMLALLVLEKVSPPPPTIEVSVDIKPGSWPNPFNKEANGRFAVAICGTEEFDVTTIDPASIKITAEDEEGNLLEGVPPLRWVVEDVSTPFEQTNPDEPDGHAVDGDGIPDLVLHFDRQEVVEGCDLCRFGDKENVKLYITGNLLEEEGGTSLEGFDWIRVQIPTKKGKK